MDEDLKKNILKTGTSLVGLVCRDGIVMAAERQSTVGDIVFYKNEKKIVKINDYLIFAGTGVASDIEMLRKLVAAELRLKHLKSKQRPTIKEGANLIGMLSYNNIRQMSMIPFIAGTLVAGYNEDGGFELFSIEPAGTVTRVEDYDANLSGGMPFILGLLERRYNKNLTVKEGVELALECIKAATQRHIGSGFGIDVFVITKQGISQVVNQEIKPTYV